MNPANRSNGPPQKRNRGPTPYNSQEGSNYGMGRNPRIVKPSFPIQGPAPYDNRPHCFRCNQTGHHMKDCWWMDPLPNVPNRPLPNRPPPAYQRPQVQQGRNPPNHPPPPKPVNSKGNNHSGL